MCKTGSGKVKIILFHSSQIPIFPERLTLTTFLTGSGDFFTHPASRCFCRSSNFLSTSSTFYKTKHDAYEKKEQYKLLNINLTLILNNSILWSTSDNLITFVKDKRAYMKYMYLWCLISLKPHEILFHANKGWFTIMGKWVYKFNTKTSIVPGSKSCPRIPGGRCRSSPFHPA